MRFSWGGFFTVVIYVNSFKLIVLNKFEVFVVLDLLIAIASNVLLLVLSKET